MNTHARQWLSWGIAAFAALLILGYAYGRIENLLWGPRIFISSPQPGLINESLIYITGIAKNTSRVTINDRDIFTTEEGSFREPLLLSYGYNIITLYAEDKFGRSKKYTLELMYK